MTRLLTHYWPDLRELQLIPTGARAACGFKQPPLDELPPFRDPEWCPECRDAMEAEMKHQWRSVVVNKIHLWECQRCGWRLTGMGHHKLPKDDCPGRKVFR